MFNKSLHQYQEDTYKTSSKNGYHNIDRPDSHWLMMIITELSEAIEANRKGYHANFDKFVETSNILLSKVSKPSKDYKEDVFYKTYHTFIHHTEEDELADVFIRILDFAGVRGIDLNFSDNTEVDHNSSEFQWNIIGDNEFTSRCYCLVQMMFSNIFIKEKVKWLLTITISLAKSEGIQDFEWYVSHKIMFNGLRKFEDKQY